MAGTLAFSRLIIKDIFRNRSRTFSSIIGVVLAVSLIAGENIALDSMARDVLADKLEKYSFDMFGSTEYNITIHDLAALEDDVESVYGVTDALAVTRLTHRFEIHNSSTITSPKYGFYEKKVNVEVPPNSTVWLNTSLKPIPHITYKLYGHVYSNHDGRPINNATILVYEMQELSWIGGYSNSTITDANGSYEMYLPESGYEIRVNTGQELHHTEKINIASSEPEKELDFYIEDVESSSIQGYVINPISGLPYNESLWVSIWNGTIPHSNDTRIYDGYYHMNTIPGNFTILGYSFPVSFTDYTEVDVEKNSSVWLNLTLLPEPDEDVQVKGYVYDGLSSIPIYDARIRINSLDVPYGKTTYSDRNGYFQINITSGNATIRLSEFDYLASEITINTSPGDLLSQDFYLEPINSSIQGYVKTIDGGPLDYAIIDMMGFDISDTSYGNGRFYMNVPAGNYSFIFDGEANEEPVKLDTHWLDLYNFIPSSENIESLKDISHYDLKSGTLEVEEGSVVIADWIANQYNLNVGDEINLMFRDVDNIKTWTFNISGIISPEELYYDISILSPDILMSRTDQNSIISYLDYMDEDYGKQTELFIKMDRNRIIDLFSREATNLAMHKFTQRVNSLTPIQYDIVMQSVIDEPLEEYHAWLDVYRVQMLAFSFPVIAMGFYLGMVGIDLSSGQKHKTFGIMKSRGANENQIFTSLLIEAVILGIIAGIAGLILGVFTSRIFIGIFPSFRNIAPEYDFFKLNISATSIMVAMIFAVILMLFASLKSAKRISKVSVIQSLQHHHEDSGEAQYKPHLDIFLVSMAIFAYIIVAEVNFNDLDPARYGLIVTILLVIAFLISALWIPFSPFVLMFSLTRLLTRGTSKVYKFFSRAVKPFAGELWYVIHKNLTRNPKRVSRVSIIIALSMGFGIFMTTMIGTTINGMELEARAIIGGDLRVETTIEDVTFENELKGIQGVEEVIPVWRASGSFLGGDDYNLKSISLFNASEYLQHIKVPDHYFVKGSYETALNELSRGDSIIIGDALAQTHSLEVGSFVRIEEINAAPKFGPQYLILKNNTFRVAAVVRAMPGLEITEYGIHYWGNSIYMDFSVLESPLSDLDGGWHFLVDVENEKDSTEVENAIYKNFTNRIDGVKNLKTTLSDIRNDVSSNSILFIMLVNIGFMTIIITVGLGLILFISINERKNELATIMARGATGKQISVLIMGEAMAITLLGTVVGLSTGLFTAYTFNKMITTNSLFGIGTDMMSGRPLFIPWYGALVILLALTALILTSFLAAFRAKRIELNQALRLRGG